VLAGLPKPGEAGTLLSTFISLPLNNASFSATRFPVAHHGFARGILDFSSVQANALPHSFLVRRARLPQILLRQERILVAPQQELYELARAYVAQQRDFGNLEGQIVRTLDDAYLALDLKQPDFRSVLTATDYLSQ
jgi:hypothetical protein